MKLWAGSCSGGGRPSSSPLLLIVFLFSLLRVVGRGLPGGNSLFFASPKKSKQKKGDPGVCVPCASLRGNLRCSVQAGSRSNSLRCASLRQSRSLIRLNLRSSAHTQGVGTEIPNSRKQKTEYLKPQGHAMACPCLYLSSWFSVPAPDCPVLAGPRSAETSGSGPALSEPKASLAGPRLARAPQVARSEA